MSFAGRWAQLDDLALQPAPATPGGPPIWVAGRREAAQRRAGRYGDVWMPYLCTPEQLADGMVRVREAATEAGRDPAAVGAAAYAFITVDRDGERARRIASETVGRIYRQDFSGLQRYLVAGTPQECAARLGEFRDAGAAYLQLNPACRDEDEPAMLALLAEEVLPLLRG